MHRFSRMHLSPEGALRALDLHYSEENSRLAEVIALIATIDARKDFIAAGYSCMRSYCRGRLGMTVDEAGRRIHVARAALRVPDLFEYLADGRLGVTAASALVPQLTPENATELLAAAANLSKLEVQQMLATRARAAAGSPGPAGHGAHVRSTLEEGASAHVPEHAMSLSELCGVTAGGPGGAAHARAYVPEHAKNLRKGRVLPSASGGFDVQLAITDGEYAELRKLQDLLGHTVPSGDPAAVYARAVHHYLAHLEKQRLGTKPGVTPGHEPKGRGIPKRLRRLVWERDGGCCAFVSADGHRCCETFRLEFDHIVPRALGGRTTYENLRLLCGAHNQYEAERRLGKNHVATRRELAQRARARAKAAAKADAVRTKAQALQRDAARPKAPQREPAAQARYDDLRAALRGLGFQDVEARRGAAITDMLPEAPLEDCLRRALAELTRSVAIRGERMARSTA